jgi:hypothetical protein
MIHSPITDYVILLIEVFGTATLIAVVMLWCRVDDEPVADEPDDDFADLCPSLGNHHAAESDRMRRVVERCLQSKWQG